jgi:hypothetical protein
MSPPTKLEELLSQWLKDGGSLKANEEVQTDAQALLVCAVLDKALSVAQIEPDRESSHNLHAAVAFFQKVSTSQADDRLRKQGLPRLRSLVRRYLQEHHLDVDLIMFVLKILAMYGVRDDISLILEVARDPKCEDRWLWSIVFRELAKVEGNVGPAVEGLRDPLPRQFCAIAFLDFCNQLAIKGTLLSHPFDSLKGRDQLRGWLTSERQRTSSYAVSATAALPFLAPEAAGELVEIAAKHPDALVRIEGAWAAAKMGRDIGLERLAAFALDLLHADRAIRYLEELGRGDRIPEQARTPAARAMAAMCEWLAHPNELGRPPEEVSVADTRELFWPPKNDRRRLWVIRYTYREKGGELRESYGLVGSTTWAMMTEESQVIDPADVYAIHCCWELQMTGDPRAPGQRSVAAGRRILAERNPDFRLREV